MPHPAHQTLHPLTATTAPNAPCVPQTDAPSPATGQATARPNQTPAPQSTGSPYRLQTCPCATNAACVRNGIRTRRVVAKACGVYSDGLFFHLQVLQQRVVERLPLLLGELGEGSVAGGMVRHTGELQGLAHLVSGREPFNCRQNPPNQSPVVQVVGRLYVCS